MKYFIVHTSPAMDSSLCFLDYPPEGTAMLTHRMSRGYAMGNKYPKNAKVYLTKDSPGTKLASLLGNTDSFLVLDRALKDVVEATGVEMECLNFALYDHKKKLLSNDYFIVNPIGTFDCLDRKKSKIQFEGDEIVGIDKIVLDPKKLKQAPDLFRLPEAPSEYFISQNLVKKVQALKPTNFHLRNIDEVRT